MPAQLRFQGKSVLITGGASGIGEATALRFLEEGATVHVLDRNSDHLAAASNRLLESSDSPAQALHMHVVDVTDPEVVDATIERVVADAPIDVLVDNAGIAYENSFLDIPLTEWKDTIEVNLTGMFIVAQRVAKEMIASDRKGTIILTSSTNGIVGEDRYAHYNASKGGVTLLAKSMAIELGPYGIRVNAVCPGYIVTALAESLATPEFMEEYKSKLPLGRLGAPEDVSGVFAFLASDDAAFITGEALVVDGGQLTY